MTLLDAVVLSLVLVVCAAALLVLVLAWRVLRELRASTSVPTRERPTRRRVRR